jgi:TolA-binding protein
VNAAIPPQLEHIILKALEKDRALRYQTAADMRADLERLKRDSATLLPAGSQSQSLSPESTTPSTPGATVVPTPRPAEPPTGSQLSPLRRLSPSAIAALVIGGIAFLFLIGMLVSTVFRLQSGRSETTTQGAPTPASPQQSASTPSTIPAEAPPRSPPATPDPAKPNAAAKADPKVAIPGTAGTTPASTTPPAPPARGAATTDAEAAERLDVAQAKIAANLMEPALNDLRQLINDYPRTPAAAEATFLSASLLEKLGRMDDAMAAHVEFSRRYATDRRVPDSKLRLADLLLKSRRPDREAAARTVYAEVATQFPRTPQALSALQAKIRLETERRNLREVDPMLGVAMPAMVLSMRMLTQQFPDNPASMVALNRLVELYEDANQYAFAAQALSDLATRFPDGAPDAWYRLGELYERRLKDPARAREAYERVPSSSPRYRDAQRKLKR